MIKLEKQAIKEIINGYYTDEELLETRWLMKYLGDKLAYYSDLLAVLMLPLAGYITIYIIKLFI